MRNIKRVLIIGSISEGAIERFYKNGFEQNGLEVSVYPSVDYYFKYLRSGIVYRVVNKVSPVFFWNVINKNLLKFLEGKHFDVILVFKGMELYESTVQELKMHTKLLVNYNTDHPFKFFSKGSGNKNVLNSIPLYDVHVSYARNIVMQLKQKFEKEAFQIPFGYDKHTNVPAVSKGQFGDFFLFIGAYDAERATFLENLAIADLGIYGDMKWFTRTRTKPYTRSKYMGKPLYDEEYADATKHGKGIINILREQNTVENAHNMRTFEVPGYGGLLISQRTDEQQEFFKDGEEAIFFDTKDELKEKLDFLRKNPSQLEKLKKAGYERSVRSRYDYDERAREMLQRLQFYFA